MLSQIIGDSNANTVMTETAEDRATKILNEGSSIYRDRYEHRYPGLGEMFSNGGRDALVAASTAIIMRNQEEYIENIKSRYGEAVVTASLGDIAPRIIDIVRVFYPNLIAQMVADIQPMSGPNGDVITVKPRYVNTAAGVNSGEEAFKNTSDGTYASDVRTGEVVGTGDGVTTNFAVTLSLTPIRPGTVKINVNGVVVANDDGAGNLNGTGITGNVNYATGALNVSFTTAPGNGDSITADYRWDVEQTPDSIREMDISIDLVPVSAKPHPLRVRWSVMSQLAAQAAYNIDVEDTVSTLAAQYIKKERDYLLTRMISNAATAVPTLNFDANPPSGITKTQHYQDWGLKLSHAESLIFDTNGRGAVSYVICGINAADVVSRQSSFVPEPDVVPIGAHKIGSLGGTVDVIKDRTLDPNKYIFGFRGMQVGDASAIIAEWIPLYVTPTFQNSNLQNSQGLLSMYDLLMNNTDYFVSGTLSNYSA